MVRTPQTQLWWGLSCLLVSLFVSLRVVFCVAAINSIVNNLNNLLERRAVGRVEVEYVSFRVFGGPAQKKKKCALLFRHWSIRTACNDRGYSKRWGSLRYNIEGKIKQKVYFAFIYWIYIFSSKIAFLKDLINNSVY